MAIERDRAGYAQAGAERRACARPGVAKRRRSSFRRAIHSRSRALQAAGGGTISSDIDKINQPAESFVFVKGTSQILYVDNYRDGSGARGPGAFLEQALTKEKINLRTITLDQFPQNLIDLQNYDAVILGNVPHGEGGLQKAQDEMLAHYVHDMGGGLVMIGGDDTFGAGGWQGSELEKVLPVDMDIPAQRRSAKARWC